MSTVLDVAVCLLLVGAALATLAAAPTASTDPGPTADPAAAIVATTTTGIPVHGAIRHTTLAGHLGTAAVSAAGLEDNRLLPTSYPSAVERATADAVPHRTHVTARWTPFPNASVSGRVAAGPRPPASADVSAATLTVETGIDPFRFETDASFETIATALAEAYVEWLFPPRRTRAALLDHRTDQAIEARYRTTARALGTDVEPELDGTNVSGANQALATALSRHFEASLREEYEDPGAAADGIRADTATVVVRRWEAQP